MKHRDSEGYGQHPPAADWPGGARVVVNVEGGSEQAVSPGDEVNDAFDWLWDEGKTMPKMMSVGLHLRVIGRPARIGGLERVLRHMTDRGHVWFARRDEIAGRWLQIHGRRGVEPQ